MLWIGNDHGGYELKLEICKYLEQQAIPFHDIGCHSAEIARYPYYAAVVANAVATGEADRGILICSTGIGMSIVANRRSGVRASLCSDTYAARMTRKHNDSNLLCLGGKTTGLYVALDILETWLNTPFEGGRHCISLDILSQDDQGTRPLQGLLLPTDMR